MSVTHLTYLMADRLTKILCNYQNNNELNEFTNNHISDCIEILNDNLSNQALYYLRPYKLDVQLAIDYNKTQVGEFPKNTYNRLWRLIERL